MQSRIETPNRDELGVVTRLARQVPEGNVAGWTNFHDWVQRTKREPAPANFLFQQLLVVTANVRTPVWITHDRGTLERDNRGSQSLLRPADVATPKDRIWSASGVSRTRHKEEVIGSILRGNFVYSFHVHRRISVAILAYRAPVEDLVGTFFGDIFLSPVELETGDTKFEQLGNSALPVRFGTWVGQVDQRKVVASSRTHLACECVPTRLRFPHHFSLEEWGNP